MDHLDVVLDPEPAEVAGAWAVFDLGRALGDDGLNHGVVHRA